jgi:oligosaccharide translocation protein RFT1
MHFSIGHVICWFVSSFDTELLGLSFTFLWQSLQKLILQEGEKVVLRLMASLLSQAVFGVVSFLGSLVVRFLFQPVEEVCFSIFSKLFGARESTSFEWVVHKKAALFLQIILKFNILLGLLFISFGPPFSFLLLHILYTSKYSFSAAPALGWYSLYIFFVGVNGVTEAFVHSVANQKTIQFFNNLMIFFSLIYLTSAVALIFYFETIGLILANCLNMTMRIIFSLRFIGEFFRELEQQHVARKQNTEKLFIFENVIPHRSVLISFLGAFAILMISSRVFCCASVVITVQRCALHFAIGSVTFLFVIYQIYRKEHRLFTELKELWQNKDLKID